MDRATYTHSSDNLVPDRAEAERFLKLLDPDATRFTFQTFDDNRERNDKRLARIIHANLTDCWDELIKFNVQGAGVFVTVNETNFNGRTTKNIVSVRVESSPGRFQAYWRVKGVALDQFKKIQQVLIKRFRGDPAVHDLPRVMRLPGFFHRKAAPAMVRIVKVVEADACEASDLYDEKIIVLQDFQNAMLEDAGKGIAPEESTHWQRVNDAAMANFSAWVPELFGDAAKSQASGGYRVSSKALGRDLEEDLSFHPDGIKDFGVHDTGDERSGKRTPIDVVMEHGKKEFMAAVEWLEARLGIAITPETGDKVADEITEINRNHALVLAGNNAVVMKNEGGTKFRLLQVSALKYWYGNRFVRVGKEIKTLGDVWLKSGRRRQYEGIEFAPTGGRAGYFNLWQGFSVEPREGDCSKFLAHLRDNVAKHDEALFMWVVGWFAQIVQEPTQKLGTSLALRGPQGAGKTKVGEVVGSLFSDHYALVADPRYITGNFNSHMKSLLLLHADEAFWAGDKRAEGRLKDLVTGSFFFLELKHIDPIPVANYLRLFVTGNQDWLVPAGFGERRFAVLDMGEEHVKDLPYFAAVDEEMNNGGREALLYHLLHFDLSRVNLRVIPKTSALLEQQIESATPEQAWWLDTLRSGRLPSEEANPALCLKKRLFRRYVRHANLQGVRRKVIETTIGIFMKKYVGPALQTNKRMKYPIYTRDHRTITKEDWAYEFPPLADCRKKFAKEMQQDIEWENETDEWQSEDERVEDDDPPW